MAFRQWARRNGKAVERSVRLAWRWHVGSRLNDLRYGHIPTAMITGSNGKTTTSRLLAAIPKRQGHVVGLAARTASMSMEPSSRRATTQVIAARGFSFASIGLPRRCWRRRAAGYAPMVCSCGDERLARCSMSVPSMSALAE